MPASNPMIFFPFIAYVREFLISETETETVEIPVLIPPVSSWAFWSLAQNKRTAVATSNTILFKTRRSLLQFVS